MNGYNQETYLSYEKVNELLPDDKKFDIMSRSDRIVFPMQKGGKIAVASSKLYNNKAAVYNVLSRYYKEIGVNFIVFTVGHFGIFVVPIDVVCRYNKYSGWNRETKKGRHYWVRLHKKADSWLFVNYLDTNENVDVTSFFIPCI